MSRAFASPGEASADSVHLDASVITRFPRIPTQVEGNRRERDQYDRNQGRQHDAEELGRKIVLSMLHFAAPPMSESMP